MHLMPVHFLTAHSAEYGSANTLQLEKIFLTAHSAEYNLKAIPADTQFFLTAHSAEYYK